MLPVADRGFRFGDGVFETIRLNAGVPYQWELHVSRLHSGLQALRIAPPTVDWKATARQLLKQNNVQDGFVRLSISRGAGSQGYLPNADISANWVMEVMPSVALPEQPFALYQSSITRPPLSSLPVNHKLAHGIGSTLALFEARDHACDEALMLSPDGHISEASSGNLFWFRGEQWFTPALDTSCLAGTTRAAIMRFENVREVNVDMTELLDADALVISNVRLGIWPVASLLPHGKMFDAHHPRIRALIAAFDADRTAYTARHAKEWA